MKKYKYSEIFGRTIQGEGFYTGKSSVWIRFFLCNLQCDGFFQKDPTDPSNYKLPYQSIDISSIKKIEDLPVFEYGCDSSYSWAAKFKHLQKSGTAAELCQRIEEVLPMDGKFKHPLTNEEIHWCVTGGESLMKQAQQAVVEMMYTWEEKDNFPKFVTFETNGTQELTKEFVEMVKHFQEQHEVEFFFSVSPKLWNVAGELPEKAIHPEVVKTYFDLSNAGQLKFVVTNTQGCWDELTRVVKQFRDAGVGYQLYGMPVGATKDQQESDQTAQIAEELIRRGFNVSGRLHCHIFNNIIGK